MDLLEEYKKQNPQVLEARPESVVAGSQNYGAIGNLIVKLSGGRISDARRITKILMVIAILALGGAIIALVRSFGGSGVVELPPNV